MKKSIIFRNQILQLFLLFSFLTFTLPIPIDAQINKWSLNGQQIDFSSGSPVVNNLPASLPSVSGSGNSFYAPDGSTSSNFIKKSTNKKSHCSLSQRDFFINYQPILTPGF